MEAKRSDGLGRRDEIWSPDTTSRFLPAKPLTFSFTTLVKIYFLQTVFPDQFQKLLTLPQHPNLGMTASNKPTLGQFNHGGLFS